MREPTIKSETISSMRNALRLLKLFTMDEPEMKLSEIADKLEVGISTAHRLTYTLMHAGFLVKDSITKNYRLGACFLGMGNTIISQIQLCTISYPILEKLVKDTGESAHIAILKQNQTVYLQKLDSSNHVHLLSHAGKENPVHCTSSGQVILAFQPECIIEQFLEMELPIFTQYTITSKTDMKALLYRIRHQGYSYSQEEMHIGVSSIAAPIKDHNGKVIASISIAGPASRITLTKLQTLSKLVVNAADVISNRLN